MIKKPGNRETAAGQGKALWRVVVCCGCGGVWRLWCCSSCGGGDARCLWFPLGCAMTVALHGGRGDYNYNTVAWCCCYSVLIMVLYDDYGVGW